MDTRHVRKPFLFLAALLASACAHIEVVKVSTTAPAGAVLYALPKTVVRVQMKVDRTEITPGRFAAYAQIFTPDSELVCQGPECESKKVTFSLQPSVVFSTYGEPDPDNVFAVKFVGGGAIDQTVSMAWNEAGLLSSAASSVTNRTADLVTSGLKMAIGLGTKLALGASRPEAGPRGCQAHPTPNDAALILILTEGGGDVAGTLIANYCAMSPEKRNALPTDAEQLRNALAAYMRSVAPLAQARLNILTLNTMMMEPATLLPRIEAELEHQLSLLFVGTKKVQTWDATLDVRATSVDQPMPILHIDAAKGICVTNAELPPDSKPLPVGFTVLADAECGASLGVELTLRYYPEREKQLFSMLPNHPEDVGSFRYRLPAQVAASLSAGRKTYGASIFSVAQLGKVVALPATKLSKGLSYDLGFIEATGALRTFKIGTSGGLDTATVEALGGAGGTLVGYRTTARENESEISALTREDQLLKLQDEICSIQKKYGLPCTAQPR
jgi:hypothetical protein